MKILIVDNGTSYLPQLQALLSVHAVTVVPFSAIDPAAVKACDAVVLSGGHALTVNGHEDALGAEISLIRESLKPVFGICYGFEVIARAFGAHLEALPQKEHGTVAIDVLRENAIFEGVRHFSAYESHRWGVRSLPSELVTLARSKDGIEAFMHKTLPICAVQFHPEMSGEGTCGARILERFLEGLEIR
jgi:GMP synthase-like glutamine amidotransferase